MLLLCFSCRLPAGLGDAGDPAFEGQFADLGAAQAELAERKTFSYPPFVRLIRIRLMHPKAALAEMAAEDLAGSLKQISDVCVLGPSEPQLNRIKGSYVRELLLKIEKTSHQLVRIKSALTIACQQLRNTKAYRSVRVHIDVDP